MRLNDTSPGDVLKDWPDPGLVKVVTPFVDGKPSYTPGEVDEDVFERLCELTQNPLQVGGRAQGSPVGCELCRFTGGGEATYMAKGENREQPRTYRVSATAGGLLWVPGDGFLWACAASITHYVDAHHFAPPAEFCEAVRRCPPMRSAEYVDALAVNGGMSGGRDRS
jgi:hypothetical protein